MPILHSMTITMENSEPRRARVYMPCVGGLTVETNAFTQGDSHVFLSKVGYSYFGSETYHIMINMNCSVDGNEFMFGLVTADRLAGGDHPLGLVKNTFDSSVANGIVPKEHRSGVLRVLLEQSERVVRYAGLSSFFMTTYLENLPPKALVKYDLLIDIFTRCGYHAARFEPKAGKHLWVMNRPAV